MNKVICFSGGKDSTAMLLWAKEQGIEHQTVFCDTGWEHPETLNYIEYINRKILGGGLIVLKSEQYPNGMIDLVEKKGRVASAKARFCTEALKIKPMVEWLKTQEIETVYQGIRALESVSRSKMKKKEWSDSYDCYVERPVFDWTVEQVFETHKNHGIKPNPLYKMGAGRIGCFPCVMINHGELQRLQTRFPDIWLKIAGLEEITGRSFFPPNYIPDRFQTGFDEKSKKSYPVYVDVKKYLDKNKDQLSFLEPQSCMSIYNLCE